MDDRLEHRLFYRRFLPHYQPAEGIFFVTYRLAFSLPQKVLQQQQQKLLEAEKRAQGLDTREQQELYRAYQKIIFGIEDRFLGKYTDGPHWLIQDGIANIVLENLHFHNMTRYELICALLMSNHVHIVLKPLLQKKEAPYSLAKIMKDHKGYVARRANKVLIRSGAFWFPEYYDHWIRDEFEFKRVLEYILQNPVKAGLVQNYREWKYYWLNEAYL